MKAKAFSIKRSKEKIKKRLLFLTILLSLSLFLQGSPFLEFAIFRRTNPPGFDSDILLMLQYILQLISSGKSVPSIHCFWVLPTILSAQTTRGCLVLWTATWFIILIFEYSSSFSAYEILWQCLKAKVGMNDNLWDLYPRTEISVGVRYKFCGQRCHVHKA
jgi:hypothetical protein